MPDAFVTGRNPSHTSAAEMLGILNLLDDEEFGRRTGHELGHVRNRDILTSSIVSTLSDAAITMLGRMAFWFGDFGGDPISLFS